MTEKKIYKEVEIVIIGGGITGLSLASNLINRDYLIIESEKSLGGYCKTNLKDNYVWDYSGHFFHFKNEKIKNKLLKNIDCEIIEVDKKSHVFYKNKLIDFPFQHNIHQLNKNEFIECLIDLYNVNKTNNKTKNNTSFKNLVYSKLGKSISEKFIIPYNEKLYACDLDSLDFNCMGRFFPSSDFNSILDNISGNKYKSYNDNFIYPKKGAYEFIKSILFDVDESKILLNEKVLNIDLKNKTLETNNNFIKFQKIVSTIPFNKFIEISKQKSNVKFNSNKVVVFNIGFDKPSTIDTHWIYFPGNEIFYRVGFYDNILKDKKMSLYVEIGLKEDEIIDSKKLFDSAIKDLKSARIIKDQKVLEYEMLILNPGYVQITKESEKFYNDWSLKNSLNDIYSIGRYGSWTYCSIEDNIIQAEEISKKI